MDDHHSSTQQVRSACEPCHERKIKCKQGPGGGVCIACDASGRKCFFLPRIKAGRPRRHRSPKRNDSASDTCASPPASASDSRSPRRSTASDKAPAQPGSCLEYDWSIPKFPTDGSFEQPEATRRSSRDQPLESNENDESTFVAELSYGSSYTDACMSSSDRWDIDYMPTPSVSSPRTPFSDLHGVDRPRTSTSFDSLPDPYTMPPYLSSRQQGSPAMGTSSAAPDAPTFLDLLRKCTELEAYLGGLRDYSKPLITGTSYARHKLHDIQLSLDSAGAMVMKTASTTTQHSTTPLTPGSAFEQSPFEGPVTSISPTALMRDHSQPDQISNNWIDPPAVALSMALALKILDVCDELALMQFDDSTAHQRAMFLKRIDASISQVRAALAMIMRHKEVLGGGLANDAVRRAAEVHNLLHSAMMDAVAPRPY